MISINNRPPTPQSLLSEQVAEIKRNIEEIVRQNGKAASDDFLSDYWRKLDVRDGLWNSQNGKCCFCENRRAKKREFDAEHFRPKAKVTEDQGHPGYWWLAYDWSNLLYACKPCNQEYKKNHFPLLNEQERVREPLSPILRERPVLINPITEDPECLIGFEWGMGFGIYVKAISLDSEGHNRGGQSIRLLGLNRDELMEERAELVSIFTIVSRTIAFAEFTNNHDLQNNMQERIRIFTSSKHRFAGFSRAFFRAKGLNDYVSND
jgi:uncharacterized protein (TIGR02646 family)